MKSNRKSISVSVRRHFVDNFFFSQQELFKSGVKVIDIGGKKDKKRGIFDLDKLGAKVTYVNIEKETNPDILADATKIPVPDNSYDIAIMGELLEHVPDPMLVLKEAYRIIKPGGKILATVPFLYPIHADPYDFGRYTEGYWNRTIDIIGFKSVKCERQGGMFAIAALMVQHFFRSKNISWRPIQNPLVSFFMWLDRKTESALLKAWTTGYAIIFNK